METQLKFEDLPKVIVELKQEIAELKAIIRDKLTTPDGYEPDVTMNVEEAAKHLKCTPDNVYKKVKAGTIPHHRSGGRIFFKKKELDASTAVKQYKRKFFE